MTMLVGATEVKVGADLFARLGEGKADVPAKLIVATIGKLREEPSRKGLDFKRPEGALDPRARTCRVTDFWRMVLCDAGASSDGRHVILAFDVLPHDDAYTWCSSHTFQKNAITHGFDIVDVEQVTGVATVLSSTAAGSDRQPLFHAVRDRELVKLGVPKNLITTLRLLTEEAHLEGLAPFLPPPVRDALTGLAVGMSVEEVWYEVQRVHAAPGVAPRYVAEESAVELAARHAVEVAAPTEAPSGPEAEDETALADAALSPSSDAFLHTFTDDEDLLDALEAPLARWRVFLHPRQRTAARRESYSGPARVTGGPGTGKSIVAIHRVAHLLDRAGPDDRILLTTFNTSLRQALEANLVELVGDERARRVEVRHLDALPNHLAAELGVPAGRVVDERTDARLWDEARRVTDDAATVEFLTAEYEGVIESQLITTAEQYEATERRGRGTPLSAARRRALWPVFQRYRKLLGIEGVTTWHGRLDQLAAVVAERGPLYRHVSVDEAQDFSASHWRLVRSLVAPAPDDIFIAGDGHQRIYAGNVSLSRLGIETRGRSTRLSINYRSTEQILRWAGSIMLGASVEDVGDEKADLSAYRSMLQGEQPRTIACETAAQEGAALLESVQTWLADGVAPHEIAVIGRTRTEVKKAVEVLTKARVPATALEKDDRERVGSVVATTMHRVKGLEYRCVHVFGANAKKVPLAHALSASARAEKRIDEVLMQERSLLYVACTRARESLTVSWTGARSPFMDSFPTQGPPAPRVG